MIVYCCADLIFATKIRSTAEALDVVTRPARNADMLNARLNRVDDGKCNDAVAAVLVDLDLGESGLELVKAVKAFDAALPVVTFGSHVATELLTAAQEHGADFVLPRSQFTASLPALLQRFDNTPG